MDGVLFLNEQSTPHKDLIEKMALLGRNDHPLYSMISKGTPSQKGKAIDGHAWWYENRPDGDLNNAHLEGSDTASSVERDLGNSLNHYQIVKHKYGITGSMEGKADIENKNELAKLGTTTMEDHLKSIEKILMSSQAPIQRVNTGDPTTSVAGKMGGIGHWMTVENTFDVANSDLSRQFLRELFKFGYFQGVHCTHIFVSDVQKDRLDDLDLQNARGIYGQNDIKDNNVQTLKNFTYAPNVKVIMSPYVADDEIIGINAGSLALVHQRLTKVYEKGRVSDSIEKEIITELTLRVNNPYGVCKLSGLTV